MWEMAIRIPKNQGYVHLDMLRTHIMPLISVLKEKWEVKWYCFLIHNSTNGVPIPYDGPQYHIRFENSVGMEKTELITHLPDYCEMLREIKSSNNKISGIDEKLLRNDDVGEAWRIIGETSEWILSLIDAHKPEIPISPNQIAQFLHYIANVTQIRIG